MPHFGMNSLKNLLTCDEDIQKIMFLAIEHFDFSVTCGHRTKASQDALYPTNTQVKWPNSLHNSIPSRAIDIVPYPVDWEDRERFTYLAGIIMGIAMSEGIKIRWGGDWDSDTEVNDNKFDDLPHFELV